MARKRKERPDAESDVHANELQHDFAARLAQHGEAFMQMFEDADDTHLAKRQSAANPCEAAPSSSDSATCESEDEELQAAPAETLSDVWHDQSNKARGPGGTSNQAALRQTSLASKAERRRFMSGKAADVHHKTHSDPQQQTYGKRRHPSVQQGARSGQPISRDDFLTMQREVQQVGASALDRKARKQFDAWQLQNLNATPQKAGRLSAAIGKGMAKKQAARDQRAHEEGIASGMIKLKGSGKKRADPGGIDKGLLEDGGLFKGGMLRVKSPMSKGAKFKKAPSSTKRAFSSGKIGNLNSNSQKAWVQAQQRAAKPSSKKPRR